MKVLILWSGAVVPAYRQFFLELSRYARVRVLSPRRWIHGSRDFDSASAPVTAESGSAAADSPCEILETAYLTMGRSLYWVPALCWHLWAYRPGYLYVMDEMDRPSLAWHAMIARLAWPPVRIVNYALQNLPAPTYHRWHHRLAMRINQALVSRSIAASDEAAAVLKANGYRKPTTVIPLWGSESWFRPGKPEARAAFRLRHGLTLDGTLILFAGSMVEAKGLSLLAAVLPRFPALTVVSAGNGPLARTLPKSLGPQWRHMGTLDADGIREFYQAGDYVILPSLTLHDWKEQIGRALVEGILCGCIALGSDSGHIPQLTLLPQAGFRQGEAESLADLLARLPLRDADAVRAAQLRNVEARFTAAVTARATWAFLHEAGMAAVGDARGAAA